MILKERNRQKCYKLYVVTIYSNYVLAWSPTATSYLHVEMFCCVKWTQSRCSWSFQYDTECNTVTGRTPFSTDEKLPGDKTTSLPFHSLLMILLVGCLLLPPITAFTSSSRLVHLPFIHLNLTVIQTQSSLRCRCLRCRPPPPACSMIHGSAFKVRSYSGLRNSCLCKWLSGYTAAIKTRAAVGTRRSGGILIEMLSCAATGW